MIVSVKPLNEQTLSFLKKIDREATQQGITIYLVGGAVRDLLLRKKILDLDFVLEAEAIDFARSFARKAHADLTTHPAFRTATLKFKTGQRIDLSSARKEIYRKKGALPTVSRGTLQDDLFRRDFTINAMAMDISQSRFGELIDPFGGYDDLKRRKIRILHEESFWDDPTRILRAVRYEQRLGFNMERNTLKLLKKAMNSNVLAEISDDRYLNELRKVFEETQVKRVLKRLDQLKVLTHINQNLKVNFSAVYAIQNNLTKNISLFEKSGATKWFLYLMGILEGNNQEIIKSIVSRYSFGKENKASLFQLGESRIILKKLASKSCQPSDAFNMLKGVTQDMFWYLWLRSSNEKVRKSMKRYLADRKISLSINGEDLKRMGVKSGRQIGEVMDIILEQKIDRRLKTREDELKMAKFLIENN